ncbi:hypothetical protein STAQ_20070 [Allostella sp. ATCC 35155]|nr:hypothetical protein STAQ_20070 [Stella sp. ATCC 35155]
MIVFLVTPEHAFTLDAIRSCRPGVRVLSYADAFAGVPLPRATYVFADLDRLRPAGRAAAVRLHRRLSDRGWPVVNDPARFLGRHDLLRRLHDAGINPFSSWPMDASEPPTRWPVFLRRERGHAGPIPELIGDPARLRAALAEATAAGRRPDELIAVEYCAAPDADGLFRRLAVYRIGDRYLADACVYERHWVAKIGSAGIASPRHHAEELRIVRDNPWAEAAAEVFELAGVAYGRVDFGIVAGRPCFWEVNTNPHLRFDLDREEPERGVAHRLVRQGLLDALAALDRLGGAIDQPGPAMPCSGSQPIRPEPPP